MQIPVFCINRSRYFRTIAFVANFLFVVLGLLTVFPLADSTDRASAEVNGDEYSLAVGMDSEVNLTINPSNEGTLSIAKSTITSSTNAPTGYKLFIASANDNNAILLEGEEKYSVKSDAQMVPTSGTFITPESLLATRSTPATWGYAVPNLNNFDASYSTSSPDDSSKFAAVPTAGNGQLIHEIDTAIENDAVDVYYGTKVNPLLRHGKYKTWVKYVAVTEMSSEVVEGISIFPSRIRNNYTAGTTITITSETNIASDLALIQATVNNEICGNIKKITEKPLVITCEIPANLENGQYDVKLEIPQYGKSFSSTEQLKIVDPYDVMQTIDREVYDSVLTDQQYQFVDARDNKKYYVTKLKNGDLAMTQNLDFEISSEGTTLSPETTDVESEKTIATSAGDYIDATAITKYSYTKNFDEQGNRLSALDEVWSNSLIRGSDREEGSTDAHIITIPGATSIEIEYYVGSYTSNNSYGRLLMWKGAIQNPLDNGSWWVYMYGRCTNTYTVNGHDLPYACKHTFTIPGDSITIGVGGTNYAISEYNTGYYAIIRGKEGSVSESEDIDDPSKFFQVHLDDSSVEDEHLKRGSVYSVSTAITEPITESTTQNESICPKGWKLDNYADYNDTMIGQYGNTLKGSGTISLNNSPLYLLNGSYIGSSFSSVDITKSNSVTTTLSTAKDTYDSILDGNNDFRYVRCIFYAPQHYSLSYDANGGSNAPSGVIFGGWEESDSHTFIIDKTIPSREGAIFAGWSTSVNATSAEYQPGGRITVTSGNNILYAVWSNSRNYFDEAFEAAGKTKTNGYYAMQDMTDAICKAVPIIISEFEANTTQLIDLRDNKLYFVSKLQDGQCWMTQNLNFELSAGGTTLDPSTSSVATTRTISQADFSEDQTYYQSYGNTMFNDFYGSVDINSVAISINEPTFHYLVGSSYTYPAATALSGKSSVVLDPSSISSSNNDFGAVEDEVADNNYMYVIGTKHSRTANIDENGYASTYTTTGQGNSYVRGTDRETGTSQAHVVSIPGSKYLVVDLYYSTYSSYGRVVIWPGNYPSYTAQSNYSSSGGRLFNGYNPETVYSTDLGFNQGSFYHLYHKRIVVGGDTATFSFYSYSTYSSVYSYGYYAKVTGYADQEPSYVQPNIEPKKGISGAKYSHTQNIDDTGKKLSNYGDDWTNYNITGTDRGDRYNAHVVSIPGATQLVVDVYYNGESTSYDWVTIWRGSHSGYSGCYDYSNSYAIASKLGGSQSNSYTVNGNSLTYMGYSQYIVSGDTVTFGFCSDGGGVGKGYGYYAIVSASAIPDPTKTKLDTKYSYTQNLNQTGQQVSDYGENWDNSNIKGTTRGNTDEAHVVTIPNAEKLLVDIFYNTDSIDDDWAVVWSGSHPTYTARNNYNSSDSLSGKLGGLQYGTYEIGGNILHDTGHKQYVVDDNTVTFGFTSDGALAGNGYGYYAMISGYGTKTTVVASNKQLYVQESICPKGWRLPHVVNSSNNEIKNLVPVGNYTSAALRRYFTNQPLYYTDTEAPFSYVNDNSNEPLSSTLNNSFTHNDETLGLVRCVAEETYAFTVTFDSNGGTSTTPENIYALFTNNEPKRIRIPTNDISYPGFKFLGWSEDPNAESAEYLPGQYYEMSDSKQLYAIWNRVSTFEDAFFMAGKTMPDGEHYAMQDLNESICGWLPEITGNAITSTLIDTRDNKTYAVAKLRDNRCWMVQDLALSFGENGVALASASSNVAADTTATGNTVTNGNGTYYTYGSTTVNYGRGLKSIMSANMITPGGPNADAHDSICPKGWSLPNEFGDYSILELLEAYGYKNYLNVDKDIEIGDWEAFRTAFNPNLTGSWNTSSSEPTMNAISGYWTSKLGGSMYDAVAMTFENNTPAVSSISRNMAMGVRCVNGTPSKSRATIDNLASLQGISEEVLSNTSNGQPKSWGGSVIDERDLGKSSIPLYTVRKMYDGKIWMTTSLRYEHTDGDVLTPDTSNVPYDIEFSGNGQNSYYVATPSSAYFEDNGATLSERDPETYDESSLGYYYSYDYATVNNTIDASICPAGWQLPSADNYYNLFGSSHQYSGTGGSANITGLNSDLLKLNRAGFYAGSEDQSDLSSFAEMGETGLYWASNKISNRNARALWYTEDSLNTAYPQARTTALQIRCVSK